MGTLQYKPDTHVTTRQCRACRDVTSGLWAYHTFDTLGHVIVENQRHVFYVDSAPGHVRSNEDVFPATFQH